MLPEYSTGFSYVIKMGNLHILSILFASLQPFPYIVPMILRDENGAVLLRKFPNAAPPILPL
jgi:hypothetical protein